MIYHSQKKRNQPWRFLREIIGTCLKLSENSKINFLSKKRRKFMNLAPSWYLPTKSNTPDSMVIVSRFENMDFLGFRGSGNLHLWEGGVGALAVAYWFLQKTADWFGLLVRWSRHNAKHIKHSSGVFAHDASPASPRTMGPRTEFFFLLLTSSKCLGNYFPLLLLKLFSGN